MSYALAALILIRLDARAGTEVSVADLAEHLQATHDAIRGQLEELDAHRLAQAVRASPHGEIVGAIVVRHEQ